MTGIHIYLGMAAWLMAITTVVSADEDPADNSEREERIEFIRDFASRHRIAADSAPDEPLELQRPLMSWTNPTRFGLDGEIFLWTRNDRPMALCGVYLLDTDEGLKVSREFHTMTDAALQADFDEERIWSPSGIDFQPVPDADQPAGRAVVRLRQMKAIASQFSISISQRNVPAEKLRILPRPIYRYADADSGVIDGAIIAFVQGTDPEAFLIIEARSSDDGGDWQYAIARCTTWAVTARLGANTVYEVQHYYDSGPHGMSVPFLCYPQMPVE